MTSYVQKVRGIFKKLNRRNYSPFIGLKNYIKKQKKNTFALLNMDHTCGINWFVPITAVKNTLIISVSEKNANNMHSVLTWFQARGRGSNWMREIIRQFVFFFCQKGVADARLSRLPPVISASSRSIIIIPCLRKLIVVPAASLVFSIKIGLINIFIKIGLIIIIKLSDYVSHVPKINQYSIYFCEATVREIFCFIMMIISWFLK